MSVIASVLLFFFSVIVFLITCLRQGQCGGRPVIFGSNGVSAVVIVGVVFNVVFALARLLAGGVFSVCDIS